MPFTDVSTFIVTAIVAGLVGGGAMELTMWLITRTGWAKGNMVVALGSLITKSRANALGVGLLVHAMSAIVFAALYAYVLALLQLTTMPGTMTLGLGIGFVHGMLVSLALVWIVSDRHPLAEFKEADFAIGLSHLAAHVVFGGVVGLVVGLAPM